MLALGAFAADTPRPESSEADRLVKQLGSARFLEREAAFKALDALGPAALPALRRAAQSGDTEIRRRAGELIAKHERQADSAAAFAPTKVRLKADNSPLAQVILDLSRQAHIRMDLAREPVDLAQRPVTLDTGETSFWEALDALCRQARVSLRPTEFDPVTANSPQALSFERLALLRGTEQALVLQDGVLPACPTAYLGAVRVRLIPDRWGNRTRGPGDEQQWALEVLSEPGMRWQGPPVFQFEPAAGLTANSSPQGGATDAVANVSMTRSGGSATFRLVTHHELPVYLKAAPGAGRAVPELKGALAGTAQLAAQLAITVADVLQVAAPEAVAPDGTKLTVHDCKVQDSGAVSLRMEVERPVPHAGGGGSRTEWGGTGAPASSAASALASLDRAGEVIHLFDTQDRPYTIKLWVKAMGLQNGITTVTYTLDGQPAGPGARPRKLELHVPRRAPVEAKFTLRNVPRP
jgi:hypothetical protein